MKTRDITSHCELRLYKIASNIILLIRKEFPNLGQQIISMLHILQKNPWIAFEYNVNRYAAKQITYMFTIYCIYWRAQEMVKNRY